MKIIVAIGGSSGSIYAKILLDRLKIIVNQTQAIGVVMSDNAIYNWELEIGPFSKDEYPFTFYNKMDFMAPFASGSAKYEVMLVCPCSMGLLGRIAAGISTDLTTRAADVILKERRKLILVTREMPLSLIHLRNMETVTLAGGIICPATPSFYGKPLTIEEVAGTVIDRVLDLSGIDWQSFRWGE
jgi:4-hydroxy-3-polyprenylbenzoate decarboxylase